MKNLKKLTILHSNDMHGDFLEEEIDEKLVGGVSLLSGYVNKVRREERNVIYAVAGDMFRGSVIDSEYKGTSTIGIMNLVGPDVATIGNHEVDYGLAHLLFLEKCADFPIINANLHIKSNGRRMFRPYWIAKLDGMKILFIGIITEEVLGPVVHYGDLVECLPYDDAVFMLKVTGTQLERMIRHILREDAFVGEHTEFYQFSHGMHIVWSRSAQTFRELTLDGEPLHADRLYTVAMQKYHYTNLKPFLDITLEEAEENGKTSVLSTSARDVVEEYITVNQHLAHEVEGRLVVEA